MSVGPWSLACRSVAAASCPGNGNIGHVLLEAGDGYQAAASKCLARGASPGVQTVAGSTAGV